MASPRSALNGNIRVILAILLPLLVFAFGYGSLSNAVETNTEDIAEIDVKLDRIIELLLEQP